MDVTTTVDTFKKIFMNLKSQDNIEACAIVSRDGICNGQFDVQHCEKCKDGVYALLRGCVVRALVITLFCKLLLESTFNTFVN
jgi:hypothetical protein